MRRRGSRVKTMSELKALLARLREYPPRCYINSDSEAIIRALEKHERLVSIPSETPPCPICRRATWRYAVGDALGLIEPFMGDALERAVKAIERLKAERGEATRLLHLLDRAEARHPDVAAFLDGGWKPEASE